MPKSYYILTAKVSNSAYFRSDEKNITVSTNPEGGLKIVYTDSKNRVINEYLIKDTTKKEGLVMIGDKNAYKVNP